MHSLGLKVKTVINEIQISNSDNILNFADDLIISTKVSGKLILDEEVNFNYNVETVNQVVYIIGIARSVDEKNKVTDIARKFLALKKLLII